MVDLSDAGPFRDLDVFFVLLQGFDQCEQRLRSGGQFGVLLSCPAVPTRSRQSIPGRGVAPTSSALSISARKLSTITFSARRTTQLATMPVALTGQVNSEWALKVP
jgi:hypothetical protein